MGRLRRLSLSLATVVAVAASVAALAGVTSARAQAAVATLTNENLFSCQSGNSGGVGIGCQDAGTRAISTRCNDDGSGTITWQATGPAAGPYVGSFTETGTASIGPGAPFTQRPLTNLQVTFHIDTVGAEIDGRKFLDTPSAALGRCDPDAGGTVTGQAIGAVRYEAIIKPVTGGSFADEGESALTVVTNGFQFLQTSFGLVTETFKSDLLGAQPLLPDAKKQCKDDGFLTFGVFKNQGDCVSFVQTHGKNKPGKQSK